ncbi:MAG: phosphopyruvate hydratase [Elusimicrobiota bacterium]
MKNNPQSIKARSIIDSRGNPTVEAEIVLVDGRVVLASVPSGASTGTHEALELRDKDPKCYRGKGVSKACGFVNTEIAHALKRSDLTDLRAVDKRLIEVDGTSSKSRVGANATLAVSFACAKAGALLTGKPLFRHIGTSFGNDVFKIPVPLLNVINGGRHADNNLNIQEFMLVPTGARNFSEAMRMACEVFMELKSLIAASKDSTAVGDEGGFAPRKLDDPHEALRLLDKAIVAVGYKGKVRLSLDCAANEYHDKGGYEVLKGKPRQSALQTAKTLKKWASEYGLASIEDPLAEDDWLGWEAITREFKDITTLLVGDDLFVTNPQRLQRGIDSKAATAILIKPNQIGTLSETADVVALAKKNGFVTIASHRSGETEDPILAHIAVGLRCEGIKTGSVTRSERLAKYNELLRIAETLGAGCYDGARLRKR